MPKAKNSSNVVARCGYIEVVSGDYAPLVSTGQKQKAMTKSSEMQTGSRAIYKDKYSGCSSGFSVKEKSGEFVDKKSGRVGYKEETTYTDSLKVADKVSGSSTEYQTQVKFKQVYTPGPGSAKSNKYKSSGSKSGIKSYCPYSYY
ncbi:hypothetical protein HS088_TW04G01414 [Tripterygium wilfordii]|uniref:Uncharacterized protein n=1 Tax=Tripterygium wilfordii TaxID=458696 RepID=A0A7J7DSV0_TRIWF|nr:hypothetical protein HS088_TW04G01414 [Tripterygium wilfordii]